LVRLSQKRPAAALDVLQLGVQQGSSRASESGVFVL
jgi:hypothetical protein